MLLQFLWFFKKISGFDFFYQTAVMAKRTIEFFSKEMPGVIYPYPQITVFNGDGGMEFPMIVNDGQFSNKVNDVYVTTHEIAHMYFPFYVGTNESRSLRQLADEPIEQWG